MKRWNHKAVADLARSCGSIRAFARRVGIGFSFASSLCRGKSVPSFSTAVAIADRFGLSLDALVSSSPIPLSTIPLSTLSAASLRSAGLSVSHAAELAAIPKSTLSEALRGKRLLKKDQLDRLLDVIKGRTETAAHIGPNRGPCSTWAKSESKRLKKMETLMREPLRLEVRQAFGLAREPFCTVNFSADALMKTKDFKAAFDHLTESVEAHEFAILAGPVGVGKTHALHAILAELRRRDRYVISKTAAPDTEKLRTEGLIRCILGAHSVKCPVHVEARARLLIDTLLADERNEKTAVIVIDEAHELSTVLLKELKRMHEIIGERFGPVLSIILVGQLPLYDKLRHNPELREVTWRASCVRLLGLRGEVREYLKHKLQLAGGSIQAIDQAATDELEKLCVRPTDRENETAVVPLVVNVVAARAMDWAYRLRYVRARLDVKAEDVRKAAEEVL